MTVKPVREACPVREAVSTDVAFIVETWIQHLVKVPGRPIRYWKRWVRRVLEDPEIVVRVGYAPDDEDAILGFAVLELGRGPVPPCVHMVYVREAARRCKVATTMLADLAFLPRVDYTGRPAFSVLVPPSFRPNPQRSPSEEGL